ncbi:TMEM175 family protein [Fructilactobacillus florum]|uniref:TMEM175 family protein n=1 Tax=Fructilactobacillus florum TaxID=640331 RepID=UPI000A80783B|nr:TMEM175 family protein [Fructilactobacillus florum]
MNKARVENLTDAIVGIIITIMVLEIKVPNTASLTAIISDFPYLIAYIVSFILMGDAWYNHNYMFAQIKTINRKIYWLNNLWIFWMSLIPVAAAWAGKFIDSVDLKYSFS